MGTKFIRRSLSLVVLLGACTSAAPPPSSEDAEPLPPTAWSIAIETHACLEDVCARYDLWLDARGEVLWFGRDNVDHVGAAGSTVLPEVAEPFWSELLALRTEAAASTNPEVYRACGGGDLRYRHRFEVMVAGKQDTFELHLEPTVCEPAPWLTFMRRIELMAGRYRLDGEQLYCHHASGPGEAADAECMRSPDRSAWWLNRRW